MKVKTEFGHIHDKLMSLPGAKFLNRKHERSFLHNIFDGNVFEFQLRIHSYTLPDRGLELFFEKNLQEGRQAHREIVRLLHNVVCSAATLVEHTRNFIKEHYLGTAVNQEYAKLVCVNLAENDLVKFVHDLRNYFVHKGLPPVLNELHMEQDPESPSNGATINVSFYLNVRDLEVWSGWTNQSRNYLKSHATRIEIGKIVREYSRLVQNFHTDLDSVLEKHHEEDIQEFFRAHEEMNLFAEKQG